MSPFKMPAPLRARSKTRWKYLCPPLTCSVRAKVRRGGRWEGRRAEGLNNTPSPPQSRLSKGERESRAPLCACVWVMFFCWEDFRSDMRAFWCALLLAGVASAGLAVHRRVQCGDHACSENEYCNTQFGNICSGCSSVCDFSSHNYNHKDCEENCQGKKTNLNQF